MSNQKGLALTLEAPETRSQPAPEWALDKPVRKDYLIFGSPQIQEPEIEEVIDTLRSCWLGTGPKVAAFENRFREYIGAENTVAVHSCTAALHLSMLAIGLQRGDEVIVPSITFAATANAVIHAGATPVMADVDRSTIVSIPRTWRAALRRARAP
jgi:dTDP-4-amino-4,6-dideoxygalactose transaminase